MNARAEEANTDTVEATQAEQTDAVEEELLDELEEDAVDVAPEQEPASETPEATEQADPEQEPVLETQATSISIKECDITWPEDQEYTGQPVTPPVTIKYSWTTLREGVDYTVTYEDNVEAGLATVTVVGKGVYYGSDYDSSGSTSARFPTATSRGRVNSFTLESPSLHLWWSSTTDRP